MFSRFHSNIYIYKSVIELEFWSVIFMIALYLPWKNIEICFLYSFIDNNYQAFEFGTLTLQVSLSKISNTACVIIHSEII